MATNRHLVLRADDIMAFQLPHAQHYLSQEILGSENTAMHDSFLNQGALIEEAIVHGSVFAAEDLLGEVVLGVRELEGHDVVGAEDQVAVGGHGKRVYTDTCMRVNEAVSC